MPASILAVRDVLTRLRAEGDSGRLADRIVSWEDRQDLVYLRDVEAIEEELSEGGQRNGEGSSRRSAPTVVGKRRR